MHLDTFNVLADDEAATLLRSCCGASRWVRGVLARRPYASLAALLATADAVWDSLAESDWREAFTHHPRLGESRAATPQDPRAKRWSGSEQAGMAGAPEPVRAALAAANAAYEARFGFICIICASGRDAADLLALTRERLANEPEAELRIAAGEQRKITRLRLEKLFVSDPGDP